MGHEHGAGAMAHALTTPQETPGAPRLTSSGLAAGLPGFQPLDRWEVKTL